MFLHIASIISGKIVPFTPPKQPPTCSHSTRWPVGSLSRMHHNFWWENLGKWGEVGYLCGD